MPTEQYLYDDYLTPELNEGLYAKFMRKTHEPYYNNEFFRGFSDRSLFETEHLADLDDIKNKERLASWVAYGAMQPFFNQFPEYTRTALKSTSKLVPYWQYQGTPNAPEEKGNNMYNWGSKASPFVGAWGMAKAIEGKPLIGLPALALTGLTAVMNPRFKTADKVKETIDKRLNDGYD